MHFETYLIIIAGLSILQSLFGVGLLVFGTPLLLSMGLGFDETLSKLLPSSIAINLCQIISYRHVAIREGYKKKFFLYCIPALILGFIFLKPNAPISFIKMFILFMLLIAIVLRSVSGFQKYLQSLLSSNVSVSLFVLGILHGVSNMGGILLTILANSIHSQKLQAVTTISFSYAFLATFQLLILLFYQPNFITLQTIAAIFVAVMIRTTIGEKVFKWTNEALYHNLITSLLGLTAFLLMKSLIL